MGNLIFFTRFFMLSVFLRTKCFFWQVTEMILCKRSVSICLKSMCVISIQKTITMITKTKTV